MSLPGFLPVFANVSAFHPKGDINMSIQRRLLLASLLVALVGMVLACSGCPSREEVKKKIDKADVAWDRGDKDDAVMDYRLVYQDALTAEKEKILPRIVEHEVKAGHKDDAKSWIRRGLDDNLKVEYKNPAANGLDELIAQDITKQLFATVKKEHDEALARVAEEKRKAEAEAARKAEEQAKERARKAEEGANERARQQAIEDAKPKPTRANYNRIRQGMTIDEVQAILGPGKESASAPGVLIATWQSDELLNTTIISITFQDGRVQAKAIVP